MCCPSICPSGAAVLHEMTHNWCIILSRFFVPQVTSSWVPNTSLTQMTSPSVPVCARTWDGQVQKVTEKQQLSTLMSSSRGGGAVQLRWPTGSSEGTCWQLKAGNTPKCDEKWPAARCRVNRQRQIVPLAYVETVRQLTASCSSRLVSCFSAYISCSQYDHM